MSIWVQITLKFSRPYTMQYKVFRRHIDIIFGKGLDLTYKWFVISRTQKIGLDSKNQKSTLYVVVFSILKDRILQFSVFQNMLGPL